MPRRRVHRQPPIVQQIIRPFATAPALLQVPPAVVQLADSISTTSSGISTASDNSLSSTFGSKIPYVIMRLSNISSRHSLKDILRKIAPHANNIIGIARCADYVNKRMGLSIYLISTCSVDGVFLENTFIDYCEDGRDPQSMLQVNLLYGRARVMNSSYISRYEHIPVSVVVKGVKRIKNTENQTHYLADLVEFFESKGSITMARLDYDPYGKRTKNAAFITFLSQSSAKDIANDATPTHHMFHRTPITTIISDGVPLLVREEHSYLLHGGITTWSKDVEDANVLIFHHSAPFRHPHTGDPDEYAKDQPSTSRQSRIDRHQSAKLSAERSTSADSTICVHNLKGGTVPYELGLPKESEAPISDPVGESTTTIPEVNSIEEVESMPTPSKRSKVVVHDIIVLPPNVINESAVQDEQTLIINENIALDEED